MKSCKEISEITSRSLDEPLPFWSQAQIKVHLLMCQGCSQFGQQLKFLQHAVRKMGEPNVFFEQATLSQAGRERIKKTLDEARD